MLGKWALCNSKMFQSCSRCQLKTKKETITVAKEMQKVKKMDMELKVSTMANSMLANGKMERHLDWVGSFMKMVMCTRVNGKMIWRMDTEFTDTKMEISMMVCGKMI